LNLEPVSAEGLPTALGERLRSVRLHAGPIARLLAACLGAQAFVLGRHVFLSSPAARMIAGRKPGGFVLLAHELAHVDQYLRLGIPRFFLRYLTEYLRRRLAGQGHGAAYRAISLEREAEEAAREFGCL
jgi:hypothetical protein